MLNVYLDQKIWIELSKIFYGRDVRAKYRTMAEYLEEQVWRGRIRCPVSEVHIMETARIGNRRQRIELASLFCRFSGGWFLMSRQERSSHEVDSAMRRRFNLPMDASAISVFSQEMLSALGSYSLLSASLNRTTEELKSLSRQMGPFLSLISYLEFEDEQVRRYAIERLTASNDDLLEGIRKRKGQMASYSKEVRRRAYSLLLLSQTYSKICDSLLRLGETPDSLRSLPIEQLATIVDDVPCLDVECRLAAKLELQSKDVTRNDVYDILALTGALPYFDAVVTEAFWVDLCRQSGINGRYNAIAFSSLAQVCHWLEEQSF